MAEYNNTVKLDHKSRNFDVKLKDASGEVRYDLRFVPQAISETDTHILSGPVEFVDLHRVNMGNLLKATHPNQPPSDGVADHSWWLDANPCAAVPDSMEVQVQLTEKNPLAAEVGQAVR